MNPNDIDRDNLTIIKGIGPARQQWFNEKLGVFTFRAFAALSADEIQSRLKADNQIASRATIEAWIVEAKNLAKIAEPDLQQKTTSDTEADQQVNDTMETNESPNERSELEDGDNDGEGPHVARKDIWKPFAEFVLSFQERRIKDQDVEYRTSAQHMETGMTKEWPGIEHDKFCQWIMDQIGDQIDKEQPMEEHPAQEVIGETVPIATSPIRLEIDQIRLYQPSNANTPVITGEAGQILEGRLKGNQPFSFELQFVLEGVDAINLTSQQATYLARSFVQDELTGESKQLGDAEPGILEKGKLIYVARFTDVALPPGKYRLLAFVNLQAVSVRPDFVTFPELNITH